MAGQIPLVDYLVLGDEPHLVAHECTNCGARFFDRRNACASCFATDFKTVPIATEGELRAFTIVAFAAPGIPMPVRGRRRRLRRHQRARQRRQRRARSRARARRHEGAAGHLLAGHRRRTAPRPSASASSPSLTTETEGAAMSASDDIWILGIHMTKFGKHPDKDTVDLGGRGRHGRARRRAASR